MAEQQFFQLRAEWIQRNYQQLFPDETQPCPKIAIACSGGSYRSAIGSTAFLTALQDIGILDISSYLATGSGSTWFLSTWLVLQKDLQQLKTHLKQVVSHNLFTMDHNLMDMAEILWDKWSDNINITLTDIWGLLLGNALFQDQLKFKLSQLANLKSIQEASVPYPIFTAINCIDSETRDYVWVEFTPGEVNLLGINKLTQGDVIVSVPAKLFGSKFEAGTLVNAANELTMANVIGICSSAFSVDIDEIVRLSGNNSASTSAWASLERIIDEIGLGEARITQGEVNNPLFCLNLNNTDMAAATNEKILGLYDAGIDYNVPLSPLLLLDRHLDILIIFDASSDAGSTTAQDFKVSLQYARQRGYTIPEVDIKANEINILPGHPTILYIPNSQDFSSLKFTYTEAEFNQLYDSVYTTVMRHKEALLAAVENYVRSVDSINSAGTTRINLPIQTQCPNCSRFLIPNVYCPCHDKKTFCSVL